MRRNGGPELGYYNPLDYGGYLLTVSFPVLLPTPPFLPGFGFLPAGATSGLIACCYFGGLFLVSFRAVRCGGQDIPSEWTVGLGEPANAILSAKSDPEVLIDQETNGGLRNYFLYVVAPPVFRGPRFWLVAELTVSAF